MIFKKNLDLKAQLFMIVIIFLQAFILALTLVPLIAFSEKVQRPSKDLIFRSQLALRGPLARNLRLKLKLDSRYQTLNSHNKIAFSAGTLGKVTKEKLFEVQN